MDSREPIDANVPRDPSSSGKRKGPYEESPEPEAKETAPESDGRAPEDSSKEDLDNPHVIDAEHADEPRPKNPEDLGKLFDLEVGISESEIRRDLNLASRQTIFNFHGVSESPRRLRSRDFEDLSVASLVRLRGNMVYDPETLDALVQVLEERRILILTGDSESGKGTLAQLIVSELMERFGADAPRGALLLRSIPRDWEIDLTCLTGGEASYRCKAIILVDAFDSRNRALLTFLHRLAENTEAFTSNLVEAGSFLVFTSITVPRLEESLRSRGILRSVPRPSSSDLLEGLQRLTARLAKDRSLSPSSVEKFIDQHESDIVRELPTFPLLARFVDQALVKVLKKRMDLRSALNRVKDLGRSVLVDQTEDFESWCAAASLTLCTAASLPEPVPWLQFEAVRTALFRSVSRELEYTSAERTLEQLSQTEEILQRMQAEGVPSSFPSPFGIRFRNETQRARLWRSLLGSGRSLPALLLPWLERVADDGNSDLQEVAVRALGRLGELNPPGIVLGRIRDAFETRNPLVLGWVFQGILASSDVVYRNGCVTLLRNFLYKNTGCLNRKSSTQIGAGAAALPLISLVDQGLGLELMGAVIREHLKVNWGVLRNTNKVILDVKTRHAASWTREEREDLDRVVGKLLRTQIVEKKFYPILLGTRFSLPQFFLWTGSIEQLLTALVEWMDTEDSVGAAEARSTGPLLSFLWLYPWDGGQLLEGGGVVSQRSLEHRVLRDAVESAHGNRWSGPTPVWWTVNSLGSPPPSSGLWELWETRSVFQGVVGIAKRFPQPRQVPQPAALATQAARWISLCCSNCTGL